MSEAKKYDALKAAAKKDFEAAVPHIEAAHRIKPGDGATGEMLINLYTQTGQYDKAKEIRAKFEWFRYYNKKKSSEKQFSDDFFCVNFLSL